MFLDALAGTPTVRGFLPGRLREMGCPEALCRTRAGSPIPRHERHPQEPDLQGPEGIYLYQSMYSLSVMYDEFSSISSISSSK